MSKGPDLSAFPIPRKGGARPISTDEPSDTDGAGPLSGGGRVQSEAGRRPASPAQPRSSEHAKHPEAGAIADRLPPTAKSPSSFAVSGQVVATTVKLDESRYLRLMNAGQPGPGRLKRRTIQEMMVEAIDEWFDRRGL